MVSYPQSVNYTCNTGYRMNGSATAMCSADGTLQIPTCNIVNCTAPTLLHGSADKKTVSYLQHVNYTCNTGYIINGFATPACSADGTLQMPSCNKCADTDPCCVNKRIVTRRDHVCRAATSECDVPEYCDGENATCPEDLTARNGWPCSNSQAYCWSGVCQSLSSQCQRAWNDSAQGQADQYCFTHLNTLGMEAGNCGFKFDNSSAAAGTYAACAAEDAFCGTLFCRPGQKQFPVRSDVLSTIYTLVNEGKLFDCNGLFVSLPRSNDDPSLVNDGTLCDSSGANKDLVCHKQRCMDKSRVTRPCSADSDGGKECHGIGVCTTATTCHYPPTLVVNCTVPTLTNGNADKTMVSYPQSVNYACNTGYRMNGSATAMCSADGTLQIPTCNIVNCTAPTLLHGSADKKTVSYLQHVNYTCNTGYIINGFATPACSADGTLQMPSCNNASVGPTTMAPASTAAPRREYSNSTIDIKPTPKAASVASYGAAMPSLFTQVFLIVATLHL
ncbi:CUB and sushi domain-containing protein 3-like [Sycon ciliatum]|uniref:CUB and sushi domain-containing protein 3-like n=1 Tax=Sycon ciliatum TaxID=27933 RepID=UPI0031F6E66A